MTQITHRRVLAIAVPMVLSNISVPLLGLVDTGVVGQIHSAEPIAAVGLGALILGALYWVFGFLRMGMTGLAAQARGAGDQLEEQALLLRGLIFAALAGGALIILQPFLIAGALRLAPAGAGVEDMARSYLGIRIWSAPAAIGLYALTGWLIAQERSAAVLVVQLVMNGLNIALDLVMVLGLDMGVPGVAFATLASEYVGLGLALYLCRTGFSAQVWKDRARLFDRAILVRLASVNGDILIRSLLLQGIFLSFAMFGAGFGDDVLAANHILLLFLEVTAYGMDGFAFAAESLVGRAVGARDQRSFAHAVRKCAIWCAGLGAIMSLGFWTAGDWAIARMTVSEDLRYLASAYLPWMVVAPILGAGAWLLDGVFIGATRTGDMRNMMALSALGYAVCAAVTVPYWGNDGLWFALTVSFVLRGVTLASRYPALEHATFPTA